MRAVVAVVAVALVATVVRFVDVGTYDAPRLSGSNGVDALVYRAPLPDGKEHCQADFIPADTDRVRLRIRAAGDRGPIAPLDIVVKSKDGRRLVDERVRAPHDEFVLFGLGRRFDAPVPDAMVCFTARGGDIDLGGWEGTARTEWVRPGSESYFDMAGTIVHRFGLGKATWMGSWTVVPVALLMLAMFALTVRLVLREARP
jgi:hypothetical protein